MRIVPGITCVLAFAIGGLCQAQEWEIGGAGGAGFLKALSVANSTGSATTGFRSGAAFGAVVGHNVNARIGGEIRYTYQMSDLKLSSGGTDVSFAGMTHAVHYDLVWRPGRRSARVQPFVAGGGGVRVFRGTGKEAAYQPLNTFAYLTKTQEWKPLITAGGGVRYSINRNTFLRFEMRDYITPFPKQVIAPAPGAKISGWLQDFVPMVGISITF